MSLLMRNDERDAPATAAASWRASTGSPAGTKRGQPVDWFYYVNGVEAPKGAAETNVQPGRSHLVGPPRLEPDRQRARGRGLVSRAVPERDRRQAPAGARRMRERCPARPARRSRARLQRARRARGARGDRPGEGEPQTLRVRRRVRGARCGDPERARHRARAARSGVYARFSADGGALTLLDERGRVDAHARRRRGTGRRHALRRRGAGVARHRHRRRRREAAARRVRRERTLRNRFALALAPGGRRRCRCPADGAEADAARAPRRSSTGASPARCTRRARAWRAVWALALTAAMLVLFHPLVLLALLLGGARRGRRRRAWARSSRARCAPLRSWRCRSCAINVLVSREGLTVFARLGDLGPVRSGRPDGRGARIRRGDRAEGRRC